MRREGPRRISEKGLRRRAADRVETMSDLLETLSTRVEELEKRVHALEHSGEALAAAVPLPAAAPAALPPEESESRIDRASGVFSVLGMAMLGIAGAYVLRAVAAFGLVAGRVIASVAIAYAIGWLVWAARKSAKAYFAGAIYAGTAALILAPMLWELTLRKFTIAQIENRWRSSA